MAGKKITSHLTKENAQQLIKAKLESLLMLQNAFGKKEFKRRIKKVNKILTSGLPKSISKKEKKITKEKTLP